MLATTHLESASDKDGTSVILAIVRLQFGLDAGCSHQLDCPAEHLSYRFHRGNLYFKRLDTERRINQDLIRFTDTKVFLINVFNVMLGSFILFSFHGEKMKKLLDYYYRQGVGCWI